MHCFETVKDSDELASYLVRCTSIQTVRLDHNTGSAKLLRSVWRSPGLQHLELPTVRVGGWTQVGLPACVDLVISQVSNLTDLQDVKDLRLPRLGMQTKWMKDLVVQIASLKALQSVLIHFPCLDSTRIAAHESLVTQLPCLEELDMRVDTPRLEVIDVDDARRLGTALSSGADLKHIKPYYTEGAASGVQPLVSRLQGLTRLQTLHLQNTKMPSVGAQALADVLARLPCIRNISLQHTGLHAEAI